MRKIILLCNMGLSTSALMKKMRSAAEAEGYECTVDAYPISEAVTEASDADCILIGPQVSYQINKVKEMLPGKPVEAINMADYGMMNGAKVLAQAKKLIGD
ncbi:MAG: PTS sugar transporter subunit IIB [Erysipelotrichaceae bacterium]|nr:PTS sugar transporter subunit IIB [Erysipelotrichaceae bacterium]